MIKKLEALREEVKDELVNDILPFWMNRMIDREQGGFYGRIDGNNCLHPDAQIVPNKPYPCVGYNEGSKLGRCL